MDRKHTLCTPTVTSASEINDLNDINDFRIVTDFRLNFGVSFKPCGNHWITKFVGVYRRITELFGSVDLSRFGHNVRLLESKLLTQLLARLLKLVPQHTRKRPLQTTYGGKVTHERRWFFHYVILGGKGLFVLNGMQDREISKRKNISQVHQKQTLAKPEYPDFVQRLTWTKIRRNTCACSPSQTRNLQKGTSQKGVCTSTIPWAVPKQWKDFGLLWSGGKRLPGQHGQPKPSPTSQTQSKNIKEPFGTWNFSKIQGHCWMQGTAFAAIAFASCEVLSRGSPIGPYLCLWCCDDVKNMNIEHGGPKNSSASSKPILARKQKGRKQGGPTFPCWEVRPLDGFCRRRPWETIGTIMHKKKHGTHMLWKQIAILARLPWFVS